MEDILRPVGDGDTEAGDDLGDDWWTEAGNMPTQRAGHNIVNLLFRVSEDNARRNGCVHRGCQCNACGMVPIRGIRYRCANCADFDLCEACESQGFHTKTHIFYKIRVPAPPFGPRQMQPVWYTGDPDSCMRILPKALISKLSRDTGFERPELEAFWEQWTFMANTEWKEDPDELGLAMDRKTFERCLVPTGGSRHAAPNLIHDRMFAFYDRNNDGYIGFAEFLQGLSYRKRRDKLRKIFEGYDIDNDGYVSRKDFLRMFRAYYVLYKQMHKDILDGLEDQLLASTEAQQLVEGRQPLSSLFGREGRVPHSDRGLQLDGKTLHRDGSVDVAGGTGVVAEDRGDTARRGDILTSLFAYDSEPRSPWRLFARASNVDDENRIGGRTRVSDADRPYLVTLIEPPTTLDDVSEAIVARHTLEIDEDGDQESGREDTDDDEDDDNAGGVNGRTGPHEAPYPTETEERIRALAYSRRRIPRMEKRRRDMARAQLHERWKRRQFYLDEEEGGVAPYDWQDNEDIFLEAQAKGESSSKSSAQVPTSPRSRSSSKVRFASDMDDLETRSNVSTSSRSIPERWGGMEIPDSEKDAGKEILYQVTQQAFNELLDTIFKPSEDAAVQARETKALRDKFRDRIMAYTPPQEENEGQAANGTSTKKESKFHEEDDRHPSDKSLDQLLSETGFSIADDAAPRNAVDLGNGPDASAGNRPADEDAERERRDPTMPQFKPNSVPSGVVYHARKAKYYPETGLEPEEAEPDFEPTDDALGLWKKLNKAEEQAVERGGWGRLNFAEFEEIYRGQEHRGNRLDYLGSWIDFCIP